MHRPPLSQLAVFTRFTLYSYTPLSVSRQGRSLGSSARNNSLFEELVENTENSFLIRLMSAVRRFKTMAVLRRSALASCTGALRARGAITLRRHLCTVPPLREQSEVSIDPLAPPPHRAHELLTSEEKQSSTKKMLLGGAGMAITAGGATLLSYNHWAWLLPMLPDAAGLTAIAVGAGLGTFALRDGKSEEKKSKSPRQYAFELVPLNDKARYKATLAEMGGATAADASSEAKKSEPPLHAELAAALKAAETKEAEAAKTAKTEATTALVGELKAGLDDGSLTPRRLHQKMRPRCFVIDFDTRPPPPGGGTTPPRAPSNRELLDTLREQVSFLLHIASPYDEVVLRVNSPGGSAADYGLAAAHFARFKDAGVQTTACVDLVAASGGYMLACTAHRILAAPFSIVGSIGVIAAVPNFHSLLDKQGVEVVQRTAGAYKRTVNLFTPNTPEGLQKFEDDLQIVHDAFITHVVTNRPALNPDEVCTGETWLGLNAERLNLIDGLTTSDAYLRTRQLEADVLLLKPKPPSRPQGIYAILNRMDTFAASLAHVTATLATTFTSPLGWGAREMGGAAREMGGAARSPVDAGGSAPPLEFEQAPGLAAAAPRTPLLHAAGGGPLESEARRQR